jgi:hypothetical protein
MCRSALVVVVVVGKDTQNTEVTTAAMLLRCQSERILDFKSAGDEVLRAFLVLIYFIHLFIITTRYFTPRYRSEAEGEGLRGPFFICLSVGLSICQSVPFCDIMMARYLHIVVTLCCIEEENK